MNSFEKKLHTLYDTIETKYRPDLRWWLAEGLNIDETLRKNVQQIKDSGFGAAEFLAMPEPSADSTIYGWGSEEWTSDTRLIVEEATRHGLGFSLTSGANWSNANLPDTYVWKGMPYNPDNKAAAKELDYATIRLSAGESFHGALPLPVKVIGSADKKNFDARHGSSAAYQEQLFQAVVAVKLITPRKNSGQNFGYAQGEGTGIIDVETLTDLTDNVKEQNGEYFLEWTAPGDGEYLLLSYWMHGTSQIAQPSVSTNYTINYVDRYGMEALIDYWEEVVLTDELRETIRKNGRGEIYMDSLEILTYGAGGICWGYDLRKEFISRKGYDLIPYLPLLTTDGLRIQSKHAKKYDYEANTETGMATAWKARMDFYDVLTRMYTDNVLRPLQSWLHSLNMVLRAEPSYGMPYEISTPAKYIDGVETESFAQLSDIDLFRGMSGSAHMYNRPFSSETGALYARNFYYNMDDWTQLCWLQFAEGVNRTVFHGYSAIEGSEEDTYWPGHEGMYPWFSERFNCRQPASIHYPEWTAMLGRIQKAMRQGTAVRDIAILRSDYAFINYFQPEEMCSFTCNFSMNGIPYFFQDLSLQQAGYTYDYFSPLLLEDEENISFTGTSLQPNGPDYRAVMLYQEMLELSAAKKLLEIAKAGLPVVFVNNNKEIQYHDGTEYYHKQAASMSRYLSDSDEELCAVVNEIKALPNVRTVDTPADAIKALRELGVTPRVAYSEPNDRLLTFARLDRTENILYTFTHSYKFEVCRGEKAMPYTLEMEGEGVPYIINVWTGDVEKLGTYQHKNGRTCVDMLLAPGECCLMALDLTAPKNKHASFSNIPVVKMDGELVAKVPEGKHEVVMDDGKKVILEGNVPTSVTMERFDITIEDWNEGDRVVNTEEKFGHVTTEVYYTTKKTYLHFEDCIPVPWKDLPATSEQLATLAGDEPSMAHVSGIGTYTAEFELPESWDDSLGAVLKVPSAGGGSVMITINGQKIPIAFRNLTADISAFVRPGKNLLVIEVASTLMNRMIQRRYDLKNCGWNVRPVYVQSYGLTGEVKIVPYQKLKL